MELDPYTANWVEASPKSSPILPVTLQLHVETYRLIRVQRPTAQHPSKPEVGRATAPPKVDTQAVADKGAQTDILNLTTLKSLEVNPDTLLKMQATVISAVGTVL